MTARCFCGAFLSRPKAARATCGACGRVYLNPKADRFVWSQRGGQTRASRMSPEARSEAARKAAAARWAKPEG